ncbi:MAG: hypothetical protein J6W07_02335 [Bacteroidales bacterium]|nr:hypothetical protein [Bacteroidales bacterium]MBP5795664.1 hypothetical protein [Bacteroidales bacterium]
MLQHPDSSLVILQGMDRSALKTKSQQAYYSLLISQALDQNSIYVTSDSLIAPAVNYYENHGNAKQKLRTCYYMAVIANNAGDAESAMEWLAQGESLIPQANDTFTAAHLYTLKSSIYKSHYDYEAALDNDIKSSDFFKSNQYPVRYSYSQVSIADDYLHLHDLPAANQALDVLVPYWDSLAVFIKSRYLETRIGIAIEAQDTVRVKALKDSCFTQISNSAQRPWIAISDAYNACEMLDSALYILDNYAIYQPDLLDREYYTRVSTIYEKKGDYQQALDTRKKATDAVRSHITDVLQSDTRFMEERYKSQIAELRQRHLRLYLIVVIILLLVLGTAALHFLRRAWKKSESSLSVLKQNYYNLHKERDLLLAAQEQSQVMNDDLRKIVNERLSLLDKVLLGAMTSNPVDLKAAKEAVDELLANKDDFILSTAKVFAASHPKFIEYLREHNLNQWEAGYCCLFLMGMYSKDLEPIFSRATSNKFNSVIRTKLGLPLNGPKLKTYLLELCRKLEEE